LEIGIADEESRPIGVYGTFDNDDSNSASDDLNENDITEPLPL